MTEESGKLRTVEELVENIFAAVMALRVVGTPKLTVWPPHPGTPTWNVIVEIIDERASYRAEEKSFLETLLALETSLLRRVRDKLVEQQSAARETQAMLKTVARSALAGVDPGFTGSK